MAFTQTQLDALESAISRGVREVEYDGERVRFGSMDEMLRLRSVMQREISGNAAVRKVFGTDRALR